ncbi:protein kinase domain-containing protein [Fodinicola acaciae]|uniref:protein kinase domain-containing protein n=1 Tax=Fodinicola acaciae TaxID=2681555 RepID=UPI0013D575BC|nr:PQQ-binding-like beta-propeller repeat protein [Fodinicola acaciae]
MQPVRPQDPVWIGAYRVLARLGAGGMGVVYLARSPGGRLAAVKVIREVYAGDPDFRARFRREIVAAGRVTGTFTAAVLDAGPEADRPWLATAYLPGLTLSEAVATYGGMPAMSVRALAAGLAEALDAIHRVGVVHRDFKPGNVILTAGGPRVIDFGIAHPTDVTAITRVGGVVGSPGFMSPEQVAGEPVGPASDVFTLGSVLAYAATGAEAFGEGPPQARMYRVLTRQADLSGVTEAWLADLITACFRAKPQHRPTAADLLGSLGGTGTSLHGTAWLPGSVAEAVDRRTADARQIPELPASHVAADPAVLDTPTVEPEAVRPQRKPRRRLIVAGLAGAGVLAATGGVAAWFVNDRKETPTPHGATASAPPPEAAVLWRLHVADYYPGMAADSGYLVVWEDRTVRAVDPRTRRIRWSRTTESVHVGTFVTIGAGIAYVSGLGGLAGNSTTAVRIASGATAWSYPGWPRPLPVTLGTVAFFNDPVMAVDAASGARRWTSSVGAASGIIAGDGVVVAATAKAMTALDPGTGRQLWSYPVTQPSLGVAGGSIVFCTDKNGDLHAVRGGKPLWRKHLGSAISEMQLDGGVLYVVAAGGAIVAMKADTGQPRWTTRIATGSGERYGQLTKLAVSGGVVYLSSTDRKAYALDAATGRVLWTYSADVSYFSAPVAVAGAVFVGVRSGDLVALRPPGGAGAGP